METPTENKMQGIACLELLILGTTTILFLAFRFNLLVVFFPFVVVLAAVIQKKYRFVSDASFRLIVIGILALCLFSPVDVAFRPAPQAGVKILPLFQCRGASERVRRAICEGKRENIDFIAAWSPCSGPEYARHVIVFFYPSRFTSEIGENVTTEAAERHVQQTIKSMKEWEQKEKGREHSDKQDE